MQNELRSLIQDQLEDRYKGAPEEEEVVALLAEFGDPRQMAASYSSEQYLVGPDLYPTMMLVLQRGWLWIPAIVVLIRVLVAFVGGEPVTLFGLLLETAFTVLQALFIFSGIVVIIFAIMQHEGVKLDEMQETFDPRDLPRVDDPAAVDRGEVAFGIAGGIFGALILAYFLRVGGLTLRFNPTDTAAVLPVPETWLAIYIAVLVGEVIVDGLALRRGRWQPLGLLVKMGLQLLGVFAAYHVLIVPLLGLLFERLPFLANLPFAGSAPEILAFFIGFVTLADTFSDLIKVLFGGSEKRPFITIDPQS